MSTTVKDHTLAVRMSAAEADSWQRAALACRMTLAEWIRAACNHAVEYTSFETVVRAREKRRR